MKIGFYTMDMPPSLGGGYVLRDDLAKAAIRLKDRHRFELVSTPPLPPPPPDPRLHAKVKRKLSRIMGRPVPVAVPAPEEILRRDAIRLAEQVSRHKLDMLWFNHYPPVHIGVPYVLNIFDLQHRLQPWFPEVSANGQWENRENTWAEAIRRAAIVTVGSQVAKEQLCHFYGVPPDNVKVLAFPTPQSAIDLGRNGGALEAMPDVRAKFGIKSDFLFYPAQFWSHKNHVNLLHALKILTSRRGRDLSLVLTGSDHGNFSHVANLTDALGLKEKVHFCGFVSYDEILAFYRQARALAYTSFFGPENLPPLEAMALGCPVILSDIAGVRELFGNAPVYVNPTDPQSIADGIELILDDTDLAARHAALGRQVALQNDCGAYLEAFQQILDQFERFRRCWP